MNDSEKVNALQRFGNAAIAFELQALVAEVQRLEAEKSEALRDVINLVSYADAIDTALDKVEADTNNAAKMTAYQHGYHDCIAHVLELVAAIKARHGIQQIDS